MKGTNHEYIRRNLHTNQTKIFFLLHEDYKILKRFFIKIEFDDGYKLGYIVMSIPDNYLFLENINTTARALLHYKWKGTMKGILERWPQRDTKEVYVDPSVNNQWSKDDKEARFDHLFVGLLALAYPEICFYIYPPSIKMNLKYALQYMINNPVDVYKALDDHDDDESGTKID